MITELPFPDNLHRLHLSSNDGRFVLKVSSLEDLPAMTKVLRERGEKPTFPFNGVRVKQSTADDVRSRMEKFLKGMTKKETIPFSIFVDGHLRGVLRLGRIDLVNRQATIEGVTIDPDFQGQGIAPQAIRLLVRWAMEVVGFDILLAEVAKENEPSRKAFRGCNFRYRGEIEKHYYDVCGRKNTLVIYQVTRENWDKPLTQDEMDRELQISNLLA